MACFKDKTIKTTKASTLLLCMQLEHDRHLMHEQHRLLQEFGLFITLNIVFQAAPDFLSSNLKKVVPIAVFDKRAFYLLTQEQFCVSFIRKVGLKYYHIVTGRLEQC